MNRTSIRHFSVLLPLVWAGIVYVLLTSPVDVDTPSWFPPWIDKPAHGIVFGIFAWLWLVPLRWQWRIPVWRAAMTAFTLASLYGMFTEYLQTYIPYRFGTLSDVLANLLGALTVFIYPLWINHESK